jgi:hypothetical protein
MTKKSDPKTYIVHTSATHLGPDGFKLTIGEAFPADHPLVKAFPGYFAPADSLSENPDVVELDKAAGRI